MNLNQILPKNGPPINEVSKYIEKYKIAIQVLPYNSIDRCFNFSCVN